MSGPWEKYQAQAQEGPWAKYQGPKTNWKDTIGRAAKDVFARPAAAGKDLATNPVTMAQAMPYAMGAAGGMIPFPMAATMGTTAGRGISDLALKGLGRPDLIPSKTQQALEIGGSAVLDAAAIPFMHKARLGGEIGNAEKLAGIRTDSPNFPTPSTVGGTLKDLEGGLKRGLPGPQSAKDAYSVSKYVVENPNLMGKSGETAVHASRVKAMAQQELNRQVAGRAQPAAQMARVMKVPNMIRDIYMSAPKSMRKGLEYFGPPVVLEEVLRRMWGRH